MKTVVGILLAVMLVLCVIIIVTGAGGDIVKVFCLIGVAITVLGVFVGGSGKKKGDGDNSNDNNQSDNNEPKN